MHLLRYRFWRDCEFFVGHLQDYPYYETQAYSEQELVENLRDLLKDIESGEIPYITDHRSLITDH